MHSDARDSNDGRAVVASTRRRAKFRHAISSCSERKISLFVSACEREYFSDTLSRLTDCGEHRDYTGQPKPYVSVNICTVAFREVLSVISVHLQLALHSPSSLSLPLSLSVTRGSCIARGMFVSRYNDKLAFHS